MTARRLMALAMLVAALAAGGRVTLAAFSASTANPGNSFTAAAAFGGMRVAAGTYTGNGADNRAIPVTFQPDVVIVKSAGAQGAMIRTSALPGDWAKPMTGAAAAAPDVIQALTPAGFQVGTDARANATGTRYDWVAFKTYANQLSLGTYTGNGATQSIAGLGFSPDYVITGADATAVVQRTSAMPTTFRFDETAAVANGITALGTDGFTVGNSAETNANGNTYAYIAFNQVGNLMRQGSYTGNGADNRNITGLGFQPTYTTIRSSTTGNACDRAVHRPASLAGDNTLFFANFATIANGIQALQADGFQVGTNCAVNTNAQTYYWTAFKDR